MGKELANKIIKQIDNDEWVSKWPDDDYLYDYVFIKNDIEITLSNHLQMFGTIHLREYVTSDNIQENIYYNLFSIIEQYKIKRAFERYVKRIDKPTAKIDGINKTID